MPDDSYFGANDTGRSTAVIRGATGADAGDVADLITETSLGTDVAAWLVPDLRDRARVLRDAIKIHLDHALRYGEIQVLGDYWAVAVWFRLPTRAVPAPEDYDTRLAAACGAYVERFRVFDELLADHHPHAFPQHHLAFLATRPDLRGRGHGTALLDHHLRLLDEQGVAAFATAAGTGSRALFARHGYEDLGVPFRFPDRGPAVWPMWREPFLTST